MITIRTLRADEIEVRVQSTKETKNGVGAIMLLYKDARCDMRILDETFGITGWQRNHELINGNLFCNISIWDSEKQQWITKQDVGTESNTEKEKGQASDSFKRACFNLGIGRELYTSPFIWITLKDDEYTKTNGNVRLNSTVSFNVSNIEYNENKEIVALSIIDKTGAVRFTYKTNVNAIPSADDKKKQNDAGSKKIDKTKLQILQDLIDEKKADTIRICQYYKVDSLADMTLTMWNNAVSMLQDKK